MGVKNGPKSIKNGIKNKSDFKTKTDPRPTISEAQACLPEPPLAPSRPVFQKLKTIGTEQKMTKEPRGRSRT